MTGLAEEKDYRKEWGENTYQKQQSVTTSDKFYPNGKLIVARKFTINLSRALELASKDFNTLENIITERLRIQGYEQPRLFANAFIEEAKARARQLVKKYFGANYNESTDKDYNELINKVAKYILSFALAEEPVSEEKYMEDCVFL